MALISIPNEKQIILNSLEVFVPDQMNRSVWTGRSQVVGLPGAEMWFLTASLEALVTEKEERPWRAFIFNMRGRQNHFHFPLCKQCHIGPRPTVGAGATAGYSLPLSGMQPSTRILEAGQYMTVPLPSGHHRTVMLTSDLNANSSGQATATLNIALGEVPAGGAVVETALPFIPVVNADPRVTLSYEGSVSGAQFSLEEKL